MILERLTEFRSRVESELIPPYYKKQRVRWIMDLAHDGRFLGFIEHDRKSSFEVASPYTKRSGVRPPPFLIVDKPEYVLGVSPKDRNGVPKISQDKADVAHEAYVALFEQVAAANNDPVLSAYRSFLSDHIEEARAAPEVEKMSPGDLIVPRVGTTFLPDLPAVKDAWKTMQQGSESEKSMFQSECLLCGEEKAIARTHPVELLVGPNRVGLVSGNEDAFLSYGLRQSEIAPLCHGCARNYGEALSYLLNSEKHRLRITDITWVYWTREPHAVSFFEILARPDEAAISTLLKSAYKGREAVVAANQFFALALSANVSRLVVRSWLNRSVEEIQSNLARYFERQRLETREGIRFHGLYSLAGSTARELKDVAPQVTPELLENALLGRPLPRWLLHQALQRARAERERVITHARAVLIKMVLLSNQSPGDPPMVDEKLTPEHPSPAYQYGRLLAMLDDIQRNAIGAKATLVDRYYGAASATPASVFGVLMRNAQNHLAKLRKDEAKRGLYHFFESQLVEIASRIDALQGFKRTLSLEEQGLFALGFYQQKNRKSKKTDSNSEVI